MMIVLGIIILMEDEREGDRNMKFGIKPIEFTITKGSRYSLYILGIIHSLGNGTAERSLGFSFHKERKPDRSVWMLSLSCYWWYKHFTVMTSFDGHYCKCDYCGGMVRKHNLYCPTCGDEVLAHDITFVYRHPENFEDEIRELREAGYKVAITHQVISVVSTGEVISTPRALRMKYPEIEIVLQFGYDKIVEAGCLCQVNIDKTLSNANISFEMDKECDYIIE